MLMTKKVLFLTHVGDPGGAEYMMIELCEAIKSTAEVMHFQHGSLEERLKNHEITSSVCPMPPIMRQFKREDGFISLFKAIPATISMIDHVARKGKEFDVVVCMSQKSFILASLAKPLMRKPIIWFMNDILSREHFNGLLILLLVTVSRYSANHIVLNSRASLEAWRRAGGRQKNVTVIYPGSNTAAIDSQLQDRQKIKDYRKKFSPDGKPLVGIFGRISPWKGQDIFLKAIAGIKGVNAVIAGAALFGEEKYEENLKDLVKDLRMEGRVTFAGHIEDVSKAMAACDVVVHCSTSPEPFGLVITEAQACGVPVIASDAGGAKEIIIQNETGQLTPVKDVNALAAAIQKYLENPQWTATVAGKARKRAEQYFSSTTMVKDFLEILSQF